MRAGQRRLGRGQIAGAGRFLELAQLGLRRAQPDFGLPDGQLQVDGIKLRQHLAGLHPVADRDVYSADRPRRFEREIGVTLRQYVAGGAD